VGAIQTSMTHKLLFFYQQVLGRLVVGLCEVSYRDYTQFCMAV